MRRIGDQVDEAVAEVDAAYPMTTPAPSSSEGPFGPGDELRLETITDADRFAELGEAWDVLVRDMLRPSPFLLHGWLREWWRWYGEGRGMAVHIARRGDRLVAALPLVITSRLGMRAAGFLGHPPLVDLLLADGEPDATARAVVRPWLEGDHHLADVEGLSGGSRLAAALPAGALRLIERVEAPVLDLSAGWGEVYRQKTSSKTRNLHRRRRRQLAELGTLEVVAARTPDELDEAIGAAFRLHRLRWAGRPDGSGFATPVGQAFHRAAMRAVADTASPRIVLLRLDGRCIAFHYYFGFCGCMYVHRLAFDPALARYSPGLVNTLDAIEAAAAEGVTRVEFLGGAERYKLELCDRLDPLYQGLGLARGPLGRLAVASRLAAINGRLWLKQAPVLRRLYYEQLKPVRRVVADARRRTSALRRAP